MTIKEAQELVEVWNERHAVRHNGLTGVALLTEKVGELARIAAMKQSDPHGRLTGDMQPYAGELAEIFWETLAFAANSGVDLGDALIDLLENKNISR